MIKDGKYRFTLQFGMDTVEETRAGKLLEEAGKRKSPIVVAALNEYIEKHPELLSSNVRIQFQVRPLSPDQLEMKIRQLIEERLSSGGNIPPQIPAQTPNTTRQISEDILDMLTDLDCFS